MPFRRLSLRSRLPLTIGLLVLAGVATFATLGYVTVHQALLREAEARLTTLAQEFAPQVSPGLVARVRGLKAIAADPAIARQLDAGGGRPLEAAAQALERAGPDTGAVVAMELRDSTGRVILATGGAAAAPARRLDGATHAAAHLDTAAVSAMYMRDSVVVLELRGNVMRGGHVIGQVVQVRAAQTTNGAAVTSLSRLLGADGALLLGNADGSMWTDLRGVVRRPPVGRGLQQYTRDGVPKLSASAAIPGTPLGLAFEFDASRVTAPLRSLVGTYAGVAALVVLLGALLGWWASRGITRPLTALTGAAEAISAGHLDQEPAASRRNDEIGRLARAFATMTRNVRAARDDLEHQVAERTAELRAAQEENVRKERLATLGQLSSSVGHELRNPLGVMSNAVYFLNATVQSPHPKTREYLGILKTQIALSEKIVADLLDFARVRPPQRVPTPVGSIVDDQLDRIAIRDAIAVDRRGDSAAQVDVDPVQIGQVLLNLITNAAQAMEETGGALTIEAAAANGTVRLTVRDTGPGIAEEHLAKVFEPLFTTKARGIGLGLSVSRSLAEANDGTLTAASTPGAGAAFTLTLPAAS